MFWYYFDLGIWFMIILGGSYIYYFILGSKNNYEFFYVDEKIEV